ncbi:MAG: S24 family peptidase [Verrucomicrobia bacterium]|nr:S24 family peptidase [Verrucomicrobiota bacterium]
MSESMIYQVLKGASGFSEKVLFRLERWEKEFGCATEHSIAPPTKTRLVPVVSYAMAGKAADYDDLANYLDETIETDCRDPNCFALIIEGDSMEPVIRTGDRVVAMPNSEAQTGDIVVARRRDTHEVFVKLVHFTDANKRVKFTSYNPAYPPMEFARKDFRFIYPVHSMKRVFRHGDNGHAGK